MAKKQTLPSYNTINESLKILDAEGDASENHGLLSALILTGSKVKRSAWVNSLALRGLDQDDPIIAGATKALTQLFDVTHAQLASDDYTFQLLLPTDDTSFPTRIEALSHWSQGFVTGLGLIGIDPTQKGTTEAHEAMADLINFSLLRYNNESEGDEEAEEAFTNLVEYAKVAVLLLQRDYALLQPNERKLH